MRKLFVLSSVLFFVAFTAMVSAQTQSGKWQTSVGAQGYNLDSNSGERSMTIEVNYDKPYDVKPKVIVSVSQLDTDKAYNSRYNVEVLSVSRDGFTVKIKTWADSKIYSIGGYWLSYTE
jgi:hypothetical protein